MNPGDSDTFICPTCGAEVPFKAMACPECGADEKTGWSDKTIYDATDIEDPDEDEFDYEEWKRREAGLSPRRSVREWWWAIVAIIVTVAFLIWLLAR